MLALGPLGAPSGGPRTGTREGPQGKSLRGLMVESTVRKVLSGICRVFVDSERAGERITLGRLPVASWPRCGFS